MSAITGVRQDEDAVGGAGDAVGAAGTASSTRAEKAGDSRTQAGRKATVRADAQAHRLGDASAAGHALLRIEGVSKTYPGRRGHAPVPALRDISLRIRRGEVIAIIGPSGCGKSTLLRCVNGLEDIQGGDIWLEDERISAPNTSWPRIRQRVGMVFQNYELFPHLNVLDNLLLAPRKVAGVKRAEAEPRARALLTRVGLADRADAYPRQLSGGQKQRIAIVRALMMDPELLLLDEVTASLDPELVREVLDVVLELAAENMTMLLVTHELSFARAIADRVVFMEAGRVVESGPGADFFAHPQTQRAREFLDTFTFAPQRPEGAGAAR